MLHIGLCNGLSLRNSTNWQSTYWVSFQPDSLTFPRDLTAQHFYHHITMQNSRNVLVNINNDIQFNGDSQEFYIKSAFCILLVDVKVIVSSLVWPSIIRFSLTHRCLFY